MTAAPLLQPGGGRALRGLGVAPSDIERLSIERIRARLTVPLPPTPADTVVLRMAYAAGDPDLATSAVVDRTAVEAAVAALRARREVVCDTRMLLAGIRNAAESAGVPATCPLDVEAVTLRRPGWLSAATVEAAEQTTMTARALYAVLTQSREPAAVIAVGNAPTALLAVLDLLGDGMPPPAALVATCPGLVAAAEAKQLLLDARDGLGVGVIAATGTRGGSAVAAAAVNTLLRLAADAH